MTYQDNVQAVRERIQAVQQESALSSKDVRLICVSKYHSVEESLGLYQVGLRDYAENYVDGLLEKKAAMPDDCTWHLIGPLQSRKVKDVINEVDYFHALDRLKIAKEIQKRADHVIKCFVQVNVSGEASKSGLAPSELEGFIKDLAAYDKIEIVGLMTMAPHDASDEAIRSYFGGLRDLGQAVQALDLAYAPCLELSMGMSSDYPLAVAEGATCVRIGSALYQE
ncbi:MULTISPECIES: YggS family pyridoxal phosphate-dependent enzyme [Aerococcus]|uniref:Pyridoxal phosphate homeostasis protein n=1 Tax=Aerococcus sanguinicola TaxID=119206 RepID=A0A5N1GKE1_9LACT|nr:MULTISPECIES: YggS family pyridoxal phosphate-dependent enzyme [Aerococcus]KAA9300874.1 YggS family pyridoxal phosphate-dependent enzyme [Aerococcus sanguinicola]MDK6369106.1 YggS family pyridoxal phosphate-dependent enzyme [Aerococcus sp. UMB9870]MDK6679835.1 YggS family pyridoxal phosphate-dependent enzyme [Aerococcus sp. UMB8608]MDK6686599.1 YggS family pyridoxal phosphate-dependent enzyme [Aerococcus sp. UMB8623]MDK6939757.1 YggS family pyridoxal phosphate-dependent enzyme [Aerococcus s